MKAQLLVDRLKSGDVRRNGFLCLLLAVLLLYNPFAALLHSSNTATVHHLARHRATVGASELQHYSPVSNQITAQVSVSETSFAIPAAAIQGEFLPPIFLEVPRISPGDLCSSLWFRPPPQVA